MRISPLDVRSQEFKKSLRGYDPEEVKAFLDSIADSMEDLLKEKETAEAELSGLKKKVQTFTEMEMSLRDAMVAAQKAAEEAKMNARRNAELMIREAELEVRQRIADAKRQVDDVFKARETVRAEMRAFLPRLRSLLESQLTYLENIEQEVTSMDLGEGDVVEAKEVRSFTETVESKAREAESRVRDESVRREEHSIERREQVAGKHALGAAAVSQQAAQEVPKQEVPQQEQDPLDAAMQEHHERQVHWQDRPQEPAHHEGGPGGQSGAQHGEQHEHGQQVHGEQHHGEQHEHGQQVHGEQQHGEQQHVPQSGEQHHGEQHHGEQHQAGQNPAERESPARDMTWSPRPEDGAPGSGEELRISHAPQQDQEAERHEDVNA